MRSAPKFEVMITARCIALGMGHPEPPELTSVVTRLEKQKLIRRKPAADEPAEDIPQ